MSRRDSHPSVCLGLLCRLRNVQLDSKRQSRGTPIVRKGQAGEEARDTETSCPSTGSARPVYTTDLLMSLTSTSGSTLRAALAAASPSPAPPQISPVLPVHRRPLSTLLNTNPTPSMRPFSTPSPLNSPRVFLPISPLRHLYPPSISWTPALLADNHPLNLLQPIRDRQVERVDHLHCQSSWTTKPT